MVSYLRCLTGLLLFCLMLSWSQPAQAFKVAFFILEPHAMLENAKPTGAAVEYLRDYIAPEMGLPVEFVGPVPFARLLRNFQEGEYDAVLLLAKNNERAKLFVYPQEPYGEMESALLVGKGFLSDKVFSPEELKGMVIGYTNKAWRTPSLRKPYLRFDMVSATSATVINFRKFEEGRIDAIYNPDKFALLYRKLKTKIMRPCKVVTIADSTVGFYTVFHPSVPERIVRSYEKALAHIQARIPYLSVVDHYLSR